MEKETKPEEKHEAEKAHKADHKKDSCCGGDKCCCGVDKKFKPLLILAAAIILLIIGFVVFKPVKQNKDILSLDEAKVKAEKFINDNFSDPSFPLTITSIEEVEGGGLYKIKVDVGGGEIIDSYISSDGKKFFPQAFDIAEVEQQLNGANEDAASNGSVVISEEGFNESANFESDAKVVIYFFWGEGCPYCNNQKIVLSQWLEKYGDNIEIKTYETWANPANVEILESLASAYNTTVGGVPMTFIGDKYWVGYAEELGKEMVAKIDTCLETSCENPGKRIQ